MKRWISVLPMVFQPLGLNVDLLESEQVERDDAINAAVA